LIIQLSSIVLDEQMPVGRDLTSFRQGTYWTTNLIMSPNIRLRAFIDVAFMDV